MIVKMNVVKKLIDEAIEFEEETGVPFLDNRYKEQIDIIGHTNPYYRLFYRIAEIFKPQKVVELGSWQATAAAHFAGGYSGAEVFTIDTHNDDKYAQQRSIEASNYYDNLTYINKWTWDAAGDVGDGIDILFIDAWHRYDYIMREWKLYEPLLSDEALVICDDIFENTGQFPGMTRFWDELPEPKLLDYKVHPDAIPMGFYHYKRYATVSIPQFVKQVELVPEYA